MVISSFLASKTAIRNWKSLGLILVFYKLIPVLPTPDSQFLNVVISIKACKIHKLKIG